MTLYRQAEPTTFVDADHSHAMSKPSPCEVCGAVRLWVVPVEPQECKLMRSEPKTLGSGEVVYEITLVSNEPANSLTMHNSVWLIGETP